MDLADIWTVMEIMPRRRNIKKRINRNREIISLQIKCYKKVFSLNDEVYGSYPQYYIDIIAVGFHTKGNLDMSL